MDSPNSRWILAGTSTNQHGLTFFSLWAPDELTNDGDWQELIRVLKGEFGAVEEGELTGPYSIHKFLKVGTLRFGLIIDHDWLDLYARDVSDKPALESFVARLLESLNTQESSVASRGFLAKVWKWLKTRRTGMGR